MMKNRKNRLILLVLFLALASAFFAACNNDAGNPPNEEYNPKVLPQLSVDADVLDLPEAISMGDYLLEGIKFNGTALDKNLYRVSNGYLLFVFKSYGYFGVGTQKVTLIFKNGVEKILTLNITDVSDPDFIFPEIEENHIYCLDEFILPAAQKRNIYQGYSFKYSVTSNSAAREFAQGNDNIVVSDESPAGNYVYKIEVIKNYEVYESKSFNVVAKTAEDYNAVFDSALSGQFVSRWGIQSKANSAAFAGVKNGKNAVEFLNNEHIGRGDERGYGIPVQYIEKAKENGYNKLNLSYMSLASDTFENSTLYVGLWDSVKSSFSWNEVLYGGISVDTWTTIQLDISNLPEDMSLGFLHESKKWYISDAYFSYVRPPVYTDVALSGDLGYGYSNGARSGAYNAATGTFDINAESWAQTFFRNIDLSGCSAVEVTISAVVGGSIQFGGISTAGQQIAAGAFNIADNETKTVTINVSGGYLAFYVHSGVTYCSISSIRLIS